MPMRWQPAFPRSHARLLDRVRPQMDKAAQLGGRSLLAAAGEQECEKHGTAMRTTTTLGASACPGSVTV